jgi:phosphate transport system permease protein
MSTTETTLPPLNTGEPRLEKSLASWRSLFSALMTTLCIGATLFALLPLLSVLYMVVMKGLPSLRLTVFTQPPPPPLAEGGGFGNAIAGTLIMVGLAALLSVPFGIIVAIFLAEFSEDGRTASVVRFCAKVLTGIPSILAGVFAYALVVLTTRHFSAIAGGIALSLLMLPIVILTAEEAFKQVPRKMREAGFGMGATRTQVVFHVVLPTALPGVVTGVLMAVARAAGETAPLLFTALFRSRWPHSLMQPTASLPVLIYNFSGVPYQNQIDLAWTASLVLVVLVLALNLGARRLTRGATTSNR